jgi:glutamate racemase
VGVIGTLATIQSGAYETAIHRLNPAAIVHSEACPLLVGLAEEGWIDDPITEAICRRYLNNLPASINTVVLACTHYPLLLPALQRARSGTRWIDSGEVTARSVEAILRGGLGFRTESARGELRILLTDAGTRLMDVGSRFLGEQLGALEIVEL